MKVYMITLSELREMPAGPDSKFVIICDACYTCMYSEYINLKKPEMKRIVIALEQPLLKATGCLNETELSKINVESVRTMLSTSCKAVLLAVSCKHKVVNITECSENALTVLFEHGVDAVLITGFMKFPQNVDFTNITACFNDQEVHVHNQEELESIMREVFCYDM